MNLRPQRKNANKHSEHGLRLLEKSLQRDGWIDAQTIAADGEMISGSARLEVAGEKFADVEPIIVESDGTRPVIVKRTDIPNADDPRARRLSVAANQIAATDWNPDGDLLKEWGNEDKDIRAMFADSEWAEVTEKEIGKGEAPEPRKTLAERFGVPPFSVLDARQGYWQERKAAWVGLGIHGGAGRQSSASEDFGSGAPGELQAEYKGKSYRNADKYNERFSERTRRSLGVYAVIGQSAVPIDRANGTTGTSIFDPVLCELVYRWFCVNGGKILDPFAGESTKGIVAGYLGYNYTGVELRAEQVEENNKQAGSVGVNPVWICGDSEKLESFLPVGETYDLIFTSPPYYNLEVYSDSENDGSTKQSYAEFMEWYREVFRQAVGRLRDNGFLVVKIGEIRDGKTGVYHNFVGDNISCFVDLGLKYYNEMILVTAVGSLPIRTGKQFSSSRKIGKTHQNVLVFYKGDPRKIKDIYPKEIEHADISEQED